MFALAFGEAEENDGDLFELCRTQVVEKAKADAEKIKLIGAAEATAIENIGRAEAEAMRLKAAAYKQYGEAATLSLVIEALPKVKSFSFFCSLPGIAASVLCVFGASFEPAYFDIEYLNM